MSCILKMYAFPRVVSALVYGYIWTVRIPKHEVQRH